MSIQGDAYGFQSEVVDMDIFEVLSVISERKKAMMHSGINEIKALKEAEIDISNEYRISLFDIKKLVGK